MSGLEVFASVAAIVSAFHTAAELAAQLEHKNWRPRESTQDSNDEANRRKLQVSFETAESLIGFRYASDIDKAGDITFGDDNARDRLLHIASSIQKNIVQTLEFAVNHDNAVLDLPSLHEASILSRKDTIEALDELKQRVFLEHPPQKISSSPRISRNARGSIISVLPSPSPTSTSHDFSTSPPATGATNMERIDMHQISQAQRKKKAVSVGSNRSLRLASESVNFNLALNYLLRGKNPVESQQAMREIDELVAAYQELTTCGDKGTAHNFMSSKDSAIGEWIESSQPSPEAQWSSTTSVYSDHIITSSPPSLYRYSSTSSHESDFLPASPPSPHHSNTFASQASINATRRPESLHTTTEKFVSRSKLESLIVAPLAVKSRPTILKTLPSVLKDKTLLPLKEHRSSKDATKQEKSHSHLDPHDDSDRRSDSTIHIPTELATPPQSSTPASRTRTPVSTISSHSRSRSDILSTNSSRGLPPAAGKIINSPPSKENNYWGFCKGAWAIRSDLKKGLGLEIRPTGMYSSAQIWRCKHCSFDGPSFIIPHPTKRHRKETIVDPIIYTSSTGIRYKWIFLAKSHVKHHNIISNKQLLCNTTLRNKDTPDVEGCSFACLICSVDHVVSDVFGNVESLMNHIFMEHARKGLKDDVLMESKCILGRTAGADEEWDINLPNEDTCVVML